MKQDKYTTWKITKFKKQVSLQYSTFLFGTAVSFTNKFFY